MGVAPRRAGPAEGFAAITAITKPTGTSRAAAPPCSLAWSLMPALWRSLSTCARVFAPHSFRIGRCASSVSSMGDAIGLGKRDGEFVVVDSLSPETTEDVTPGDAQSP